MTLTQRHIKGGSPQGFACSVGALLATLPADKAAELQKDLDADVNEVGHTEIERSIADDGLYVGIGQVGKHRRGDCRCGRTARRP